MSDTNVKVVADRQDVVAIADAVREKTGKTEKMSLGAIARNIRGIGAAINLDTEITEQETKIAVQDTIIENIITSLDGKVANSGIDTSDATAITSDILIGKTAYVNGRKLTGTHECNTGGSGGSSSGNIVFGETTPIQRTSFVIPEIIGKDNVIIFNAHKYEGEEEDPGIEVEAGVRNFIITTISFLNGEYHVSGFQCSGSGDSCIAGFVDLSYWDCCHYDKITGRFYFDSVYEYFVNTRHIYIAW